MQKRKKVYLKSRFSLSQLIRKFDLCLEFFVAKQGPVKIVKLKSPIKGATCKRIIEET